MSIGVAEKQARVNRPLAQRTPFSSDSSMMTLSKDMPKAFASNEVRSTEQEAAQDKAESLLRPRRAGSISMTLLDEANYERERVARWH